MVLSNDLKEGMFISVKDAIYRVGSVSFVTGAKGDEFVSVQLFSPDDSQTSVEKIFRVGQEVKEASFEERELEYLYSEGDEYLFLDLYNYEKIYIPKTIIRDSALFLKSGVVLFAKVYNNHVFSVELPHFLEIMVSKTDVPEGEMVSLTHGTKKALLETGVEVNVPPFIEIGDVIKIDTRTHEYIQRV